MENDALSALSICLPSVGLTAGGAEGVLGRLAGSTVALWVSGTCGERHPQSQPGRSSRRLYPHASQAPLAPPAWISDGDPYVGAAGSRRGHPGRARLTGSAAPPPRAGGGWANLAPIGPGQAVTEAETPVMIGFLGREEVL